MPATLKKTHYQILDVDKTATPEEIKKAYRQKALDNHPDKNQGNKEAEARMKEIIEANEVLSNEGKRKEYDKQLAANTADNSQKRKRQNWQSSETGTSDKKQANDQKEVNSSNFLKVVPDFIKELFSELNSQEKPVMGPSWTHANREGAALELKNSNIATISGIHDEFNQFVAKQPKEEQSQYSAQRTQIKTADGNVQAEVLVLTFPTAEKAQEFLSQLFGKDLIKESSDIKRLDTKTPNSILKNKAGNMGLLEEKSNQNYSRPSMGR